MKKVSKLRTSNENVSPLMVELDDNRGLRYLQSTTVSPGFQPYAAENFDVTGSPSQLAKYFYAVSPVSAKSGDSFTSPIYGSSKYRLAKTPPYSGTSNSSGGNSSFSSRGRLSLSPLASIENLERKQLSSPRMYQTPVKGGEEVIVMDDIQVRPMSGGKNRRSSSSSSSSSGRGSSSSSSSSSKSVLFKKEVCRAWEESGNCRYNSKCQFAHGREELHLSRLSMKSKSEAQMGRLSMRAGLCLYGPDSRILPESAEVAESGPVVTRLARSQPASPEPHRTHASLDSRIVPESAEVAEPGPAVTRLARSQPTSPEPHRTPVNPNTISDWSPLDDGIEAVLPNGSDRVPSREEVDAYIFGILNQPTTKRRLPVFAALCEGQ